MELGPGVIREGVAVNISDNWGTLDAIAHEYVHGIDNHAKHLNQDENIPKSIEEAFCDIFGILIEASIKPIDWSIQDEFFPVGNHNIRNLANPKANQNADTYQGQYWVADYSAPYTNSTVISHWFYLLVNGSNGEKLNDLNCPYNFTVMPTTNNVAGIDIASRIAYDILTQQFSSTDDPTFIDFRDKAIVSAKKIAQQVEPSYGATLDDYLCHPIVIQTANALKAVGLPFIGYTCPNYQGCTSCLPTDPDNNICDNHLPYLTQVTLKNADETTFYSQSWAQNPEDITLTCLDGQETQTTDFVTGIFVETTSSETLSSLNLIGLADNNGTLYTNNDALDIELDLQTGNNYRYYVSIDPNYPNILLPENDYTLIFEGQDMAGNQLEARQSYPSYNVATHCIATTDIPVRDATEGNFIPTPLTGQDKVHTFHIDPCPPGRSSNYCFTALFDISLVCGIATDIICPNTAVTFVNQSTNDPALTYAWNFGEGASILPFTENIFNNHTITWTTEGIKTITLIVTNTTTGHTEIYTKNITLSSVTNCVGEIIVQIIAENCNETTFEYTLDLSIISGSATYYNVLDGENVLYNEIPITENTFTTLPLPQTYTIEINNDFGCIYVINDVHTCQSVQNYLDASMFSINCYPQGIYYGASIHPAGAIPQNITSITLHNNPAMPPAIQYVANTPNEIADFYLTGATFILDNQNEAITVTITGTNCTTNTFNLYCPGIWIGINQPDIVPYSFNIPTETTAPQTVCVGQQICLPYSVMPINGTITNVYTNRPGTVLPTDATNQTGTFCWTPTADNIGTNTLRFYATRAGGTNNHPLVPTLTFADYHITVTCCPTTFTATNLTPAYIGCNGALLIGGTANIISDATCLQNYSIANGINQTAYNLQAGNNTIYITANGNTYTSTVNIPTIAVDNNALQVTANTTKSEHSCNTDYCTGTITLSAQLNINETTTNTNNSYTWSDCALCNTPTRTNLCAGNYTVTVTNTTSGCSKTATYTVFAADQLTYATPYEQVMCCVENTNNLTVKPTDTGITYPDALQPTRPAYTITTNQNWTNTTNPFNTTGALYFATDLVIASGAQLDLQNISLHFAPHTRILVQGDGILRVGNQTTIDGFCNAMWQGIQVEGATTANNNTPAAAYFNNCTIQNAMVGIAGMNIPLMNCNNIAAINTTSDNAYYSASSLALPFLLYPNPTNNIASINYQLVDKQIATISLFDLTGRLLSTVTLSNSGTYSFDTNSYPSGIYLCQIKVDGKLIKTEKLVVTK